MTPVNLGFGTYRISVKNPDHVDALVYALQKGVRLVDTSTNYADGDSERAVGEALARSGVKREEVTLVSKAGYIQGSLLQSVLSGETEALESVPWQEGCWHSIHPDFLKRQLTASLRRLKTPYVDTYLLHNPEYFLMHAVRSPEEAEAARKEMRRRILEAFIALEEEVQAGRIGGYGISSNAFAKKADDPHFLPYDRLPELAAEAAAETGRARHAFTTVQLPLNLLETEGLRCAAWAKEQGLTVLVNRPLNAFDGQSMRRLASYRAKGYETAKNALLEAADAFSMSELRTVVNDLDTLTGRFAWPGAAEEALRRQAIPFIQGILSRTPDPAAKEAVIPLLNPFLEAWRAETARRCGETTLSLLRSRGHEEADHPIQRYALRWLLNRPEVDTVLLGMRRRSYVDEALELSGS